MSERLGSLGVMNSLISAAALVPVAIFALAKGVTSSGLTIALALLYAIFCVGAQVFLMRAMALGRVATVSFFYSCGFLLPTAAGIFIWRETVSPVGVVGILTLLVAMSLISKRDESDGKSGFAGVIFAILAMLSSGMMGLLQKLHQTSAVKSELGGFLVVAMSAATLLSMLLALVRGKDEPLKRDLTSLGRTGLIRALVCGLCFGTANVINLLLTGIIPAVIFFPTVNGGCVLLSSLAAWLCFGEKPDKRRLAGLTCGLVGILLVALK